MHGVGERGVQCCEVLGDVITVECRSKLGGAREKAIYGGNGGAAVWLYSHWPVPDMKTNMLCCGISMGHWSQGSVLNLGTRWREGIVGGLGHGGDTCQMQLHVPRPSTRNGGGNA